MSWIDEANALIRQAFPKTHVVDFTTASSNALDFYHSPWGYEGLIAHSNQRLHDVRAGRVLAALMQSAFTTEAPVLQAETRLWNDVAGLSVLGMRWDTSSLPDDATVREAIVAVRSTYRGAPGAAQETRSVGLQWANGEAEDGWQADDWPASLSATAYSGSPTIGEGEERATPWSFTLTDPSTVSRTGYTGLFGFVTPSTLPPAETYFSFDVMSYDSAFGPERICVGDLKSNAGTLCPLGDECTGGAICLSAAACGSGPNKGSPCSGDDDCPQGDCLAADGAPQLHVYYCIPTPTVTPASTHTSTPVSTSTLTPSLAASPNATPSSTAVAATETPSAGVTQTPALPQTVTGTATHTPDEPTPASTPTPPPAPCAGDCDGSGDVAIDELVFGVTIAHGMEMIDRCPAFDPSGNSLVEISELIAAVAGALDGCPGSAGGSPAARGA